MPLNIDFQQILLHMLNFVILAGGLTFLLYRPVADFLEQRQKHFAEIDRQNAEKAAENELLKAEYEAKLSKADEEIAALRARTEQEMVDVSRAYLEEARTKANAIVTAAEHDAEVRKEHILDAAQTEIGELVVSAAQKLLQDTAGPQQDSILYDAFIRIADKAVTNKRGNR